MAWSFALHLTLRLTLRLLFSVFLLILVLYVSQPLYWKISATVHEIRENRQSVKEGITKIVLEAQQSVNWFMDESD